MEKRSAERGKKSPRIQTGGPAELMGSRRAAFLWGNHLHNGKVFGVGAESSPLVGTVGEVGGTRERGRKRKSAISQRTDSKVLQVGDVTPCYAFFARRHLPASSAKQFTNNLSDAPGQ